MEPPNRSHELSTRLPLTLPDHRTYIRRREKLFDTSLRPFRLQGAREALDRPGGDPDGIGPEARPSDAQVLKLLNRIVFGTELLRMSGGTRALAGKLGESLKWYSGNHVKRLDIRSQGIFLHSEKAALGPFSRVICAVQANQLDFLPPNFSRERKLLGSFSYDTGTLWTHRDHRFMPQRRNDWRPLHYQMSDGFDPSMFTVWVNPIEPTLSGSEPVFQTWNPLFEPEPQTVLSRVPLQRAVVSRQNSALLSELARIHKEPDRRVFFCGSYAAPGVPLLESAVCSSLRLVRCLGPQTPYNSADKIFGSNSELEKFPDLAA